jgi:type II secretory pathway pseudopilin PulG
MTSASTGIRAGWQSCHDHVGSRRAFTLLEALVALGMVLVFAVALLPYLSQARRIVAGADRRVAAHALLRTLIEQPIARQNAASSSREGEIGGLRWSVRAEPVALLPPAAAVPAATPAPRERANWSTVRIVATVSWAPGRVLAAETIRLVKAE